MIRTFWNLNWLPILKITFSSWQFLRSLVGVTEECPQRNVLLFNKFSMYFFFCKALPNCLNLSSTKKTTVFELPNPTISTNFDFPFKSPHSSTKKFSLTPSGTPPKNTFLSPLPRLSLVHPHFPKISMKWMCWRVREHCCMGNLNDYQN